MKNLKFVWNSLKNFDFRFFLKKISMFVEIFETVDFGQKFEKNRFWSKFSKISICIKLIKIWFLSKIFENHDFSQDFQKSCLITKFVKNLNFDKKNFFGKSGFLFQNFEKSWLGSKFMKISISAKKKS